MMTGMTIQILLIFNRMMTTTHAPSFGIIAIFPHLLALPLLFVIAALTFFHISLKVRDGSPLSFILALLFLGILPYPLFRVSQLYIYPLILQFNLFSLNNSFDMSNYIAIGLAAISAIFLIINIKQFGNEGAPLQQKSKILIVSFFILVTVPIIIFCSFIYYRSTHQNYEFESTQNKVAFHIYKPALLPKGRIYETVFYIPQQYLYKKNITVQVDFNYPLNELMKGKKTGLLSLKQTSVDKKFDLGTFVKSYKKEVSNIQTVNIKNADKKKGFIKQKKDAKYLLFLSDTQTLVVISAFYIDTKDLLAFAESLH